MSFFVASLNSGSNGNCYYLSSQESAVIVDTGLSCRETEKRLKRLGRSLRSVKGIFITHEHGDHIHGLPGISRKFRIPIYVSPATIAESKMAIDRSLIHGIPSHEPITVGDIQVTSFLKS